MPSDTRPPIGTVTIRDVAEYANVALSSVSRVFTNHPDVSPAMRDKVKKAAAELGYEPDHLAQSLRSGRTMTVGFLLRDIANPLFADIAKRCEHDLRFAGYSMIMMSSDGDAEVEANNLSVLRRRRVDCVIASLVSETAPATVRELMALQMPLVLVDRDVPEVNASSVLTHHYPGVRKAADALLAAGHTRVSFITGTPDVRSSRERVAAIRDSHEAAGLTWDETLIRYGRFDSDWGLEATRELLQQPDRPTALITGGIGPSTGALRALQEAELTIGKDIIMVALDEWPEFDVLSRDIASVHRDAADLGLAIAQHTLDALKGEPPSRQLLPTVFEPRGLSLTL